MVKNSNAHSIRMVESLKTVVGEEAAREFEEKYPLSKSADYNRKFKWAKEASEYLEEKYDQNTNMQIREKCICNDGNSTAKIMHKCLDKTNSISEFVTRFNDTVNYARLEYLSDHKLLFCYPECYCGCVKRVDESLPPTWCYCTLGYTKSLFMKVFKKDVKVELIESIKMGNQRCAMSVEW